MAPVMTKQAAAPAPKPRKAWKTPALTTRQVAAPAALMICTPPHQQCPLDSGCYISDPCTECVNSC